MADKTWTENEIKSLIKSVLKQELKDISKSIDDIKKKQDSQTDEEKVKEIVRKTITNMYKFFWQKSGMYINQI